MFFATVLQYTVPCRGTTYLLPPADIVRYLHVQYSPGSGGRAAPRYMNRLTVTSEEDLWMPQYRPHIALSNAPNRPIGYGSRGLLDMANAEKLHRSRLDARE